MKIRSKEELDQVLDEDLAWRRKELTTLNLSIKSARGHVKRVLMRAAVALFYSHWEGHIKHCAKAYLCYLNKKAPLYSEISDNFIQLTLGERFKEGFSIKKFKSQKDIYEFIVNKEKGKFSVNSDTAVDTESNLKYEVFSNILNQLGLINIDFELKEQFIDKKLVHHRNMIAHGERIDDKEVEDTYNEIESKLISMIEAFQTLVRNAVDTESYLKRGCNLICVNACR